MLLSVTYFQPVVGVYKWLARKRYTIQSGGQTERLLLHSKHRPQAEITGCKSYYQIKQALRSCLNLIQYLYKQKTKRHCEYPPGFPWKK